MHSHQGCQLTHRTMHDHHQCQLAHATGTFVWGDDAAADAATRVFNVAELMENIMLRLSANDILCAMKAVEVMRDTVLGSKAIQERIGLRPDTALAFEPLLWSTDALPDHDPEKYRPDAPDIFRLKRLTPGLSFCGFVFNSFDGMYAKSYDFRPHRGSSAGPGDSRLLTTAYFTITGHGDFPLQKMGSRVAVLSPTSIPTQEMSIVVHCDNCTANFDNPPTYDYPASFECTAKTNGTFITMGDMQKATIDARTEHYSKCKNQAGRDTENCRVEFIADVPLKADDPIMVARQEGFDGGNHHRAWRRCQGWPEFLEPVELSDWEWASDSEDGLV